MRNARGAVAMGAQRAAAAVSALLAASGTALGQPEPLTPTYDGEPVTLRPLSAEAVVFDQAGRWTGEPTAFAAGGRIAADATALRAELDRVRDRRDADFVSPVFALADGSTVIATREIYVGYEPGALMAPLGELIDRDAAVVDPAWRGKNIALVRAAATDGLAALAEAEALSRLPGVTFAEVDMVVEVRPSAVPAPNDPLFAQQWGLENTGQQGGTPGIDIRALEAWEITTGDPGLLTVIIDVGVDQSHPDINQLPGQDFTNEAVPGGGPGNVCDIHGTWVAGRISAIADNGLNVAGVAPTSTTISARIGISNTPSCNLAFSAQLDWIADSILWAETIGARVTNNSNAINLRSSLIRIAYEDTLAAGVIHFGSAGNNGESSITYPADLPTVNAIGALARDGTLAFFSNFGGGLSMVGPGLDVPSTDRVGPTGDNAGSDAIVSGTSFASPTVAGVAALVLSLDPQLDAFETEDILKASALDLGAPGRDGTFGDGLVDARAALELAACFRSWSQAPSGPSPRALAAMAYDPVAEELIAFGGLQVFFSNSETWAFDGAGWTRVATTGPSARYGHSMAWDRVRERIVLMGGFSGASAVGDTWTWDGSAWTPLLGASPGPRFLHSMTWDEQRQAIVLFGGRDGAGLLGDTWVLGENGWERLATPTAPTARDNAAMASDPETGRAVLFGGTIGGDELWRLGDNGWDLIPTPGGPDARERHALVNDTQRGSLILFGGRDANGDALNDAWEWIDGAWTLRSLTGPTPRDSAAAGYLASEGRTIVLGGLDGDAQTLDAAWSFFIEPPVVTTAPSAVQAELDGAAAFSADATGKGPLAFQWLRDGVPLANSQRVTGAASAALRISPVRAADLGEYSVRITDLCGRTETVPVPLDIVGGIDLTGDGLVNAADLYEQNRNPTDIDGDGSITPADTRALEDFVRDTEAADVEPRD